MSASTTSFAEVRERFEQYLAEAVYATMVTVDARGRPRARVLIAVWETTERGPVGWLATYRTPVKATHLSTNPHVTFSYWTPRQNAVHVDAVAQWVDDPSERRRVWDLYVNGSPSGVGYHPGSYWRGGPGDPTYSLLRIDPWRVQLVRGTDLASTIWRAPDATGPSAGAT